MSSSRDVVGFEAHIDYDTYSVVGTVRIKFDRRICDVPKKSGEYPMVISTSEQVADFDLKTPEYNCQFHPAAMVLGNRLIGDGTNGVLAVMAVSPMIIQVDFITKLVNIGRLMDQISMNIEQVNQDGWPAEDPYASV